MKQHESIPTPSSLMESMREIGYSIESSIADIIDNSITAKAKSVDIRYSWNDHNPWIAIIDDGHGMGLDTLIQAMKMGSANPNEVRELDDMGRFGLGMKTASLSQSRKFSVLSKYQNTCSVSQWDLDLLSSHTDDKWMLNIFEMNEIEETLNKLYEKYLKDKKSGTIVFWDKIDRLDLGEIRGNREAKFNEAMMGVREHLELVFHRYLSPSLGKRKISITINQSGLEPFDPFFVKKAEELNYEEFIYGDSVVAVQPYVLPHHSRVNKEEYKRYGGRRDYLQEQGFYIYRNRRLIIHANWFRLIPKAEITKLLRVKIDIPNSLDHIWKIDVKKSNAIPPIGVRKELKRIVSKIEISGSRVYKRRGKRLIANVKEPSWERLIKNKQIEYKINREHTLVKKHLRSLNDSQKRFIENLLCSIESSFPKDMYFNDIATEPEKTSLAPLSMDQIETLLSIYIDKKGALPTKEKLKDILKTDPFASNIEITKKVFDKLNYEY